VPELLRNSLELNRFLKTNIINKERKAFAFSAEKQDILFLNALI
jgi:hypothetical protein